MKEYVALWQVGDVTRGEIIMLSDEDAAWLLKIGAIKPFGGTDKAREPKKPEPEIPMIEEEVPEIEEESAEIEDGVGAEAEDESEADEDAEVPEIDALDAIGEAQPEPEVKPAKPAKSASKSRKSAKKEG